MDKQYQIEFFTHDTGVWWLLGDYSNTDALIAIRKLRTEYPFRQWRIVTAHDGATYDEDGTDGKQHEGIDHDRRNSA